MPPMFFIWRSCSEEVGEIETVAFLQLEASFSACARSTLLSISSISDSTSPMPRMREGDAVRMERLQRFGFLADAEEFNRLAGNMANRQRRAAAGVAVHFGQHHAGQRQRFVKGFGGIRRILAGHRIDDEQGFNRINGGVDVLNFVHHRFVNVQTTGGIHQQHVVEFELASFSAALTISTGFWPTSDGKKSTPTCSARVSSCLIAAGR